MIHSKGEINESTKVGDLEGWELISPSQLKASKEYKSKKAKSHKEKEFVFMKKEYLREVSPDLKMSEIGLLLFLARYLKLNDNGQLTHKAERITVSKLAKLINKTDRQVRTILAELEKKSLIFKMKEGKETFIDLSDELFTCGALSNKETKTVKIFKVKLSQIAKELSLNELGLFMLMLNQLHWKTHVLCENPDEQDLSKVMLWRRKDISECTGSSKSFVNSTLSKLRALRVVVEVKTINEGIVLHPSIASRQQPNPTWENICDAIDLGFTKENYKGE